MLFALVPLLDVRHVKPSQLLRDEELAAPRDLARWVAMVAVGAALVGVTMWQAGSVRIGGIVAVGFAVVAVVLYFAGRGLIAAVRPLAASPWFPLRHAALQLTRPGGQVHLVLLDRRTGHLLHPRRARPAGEPRCARSRWTLRLTRPTCSCSTSSATSWTACWRALTASMPPAGAAPARPARVACPRDRRAGPRGHARRLRGRARPRLAGPRVHGDLPLDARGQRADRGRRSLGRHAGAGRAKCRSRRASAIDSASTSATPCDSTCSGRVVSATVTTVRRVDWSDSRAGGFMFVFRPGLLDTAPHGHIAFVRGPASTADRASLLGRLAETTRTSR